MNEPWRHTLQLERTVTRPGERPTGEGWKCIHSWANPSDRCIWWLWQRVSA